MPYAKNLCLLTLLLPLASSGLVGFFGKKIGRSFSHRIAIIAVGISFFLSVWINAQLYNGNMLAFNTELYTWAISGDMKFTLGLMIDKLTAVMMLVVTFVSWMVHIYTIGYMKDDPGYQRFFSYISLFTFGMLMLIMSNNFLQLFFGWEMVGLMSYLLIGFWYQKESAVIANLKAFLVNRVGDLGFVLGIAGIAFYTGSLDYEMVFNKMALIAENNSTISILGLEIFIPTFICLLLFIGAMAKSAQVPLHVWLPDSMEGPTPISALIHAATMVTAGVFMIARLSPIYEYSESALNTILIIGAISSFLMGLVGIVQSDIKRIIAYSTLSQLGYMMVAMGVSAYSIGIFHLITHAFFKALLFLAAGSIILALHHEQDIWKMGNLKRYMPITYITTLIGCLALAGVPFFSGFYSKDLVIEAVKLSETKVANLVYPFILSGVYITALYTFRLFFVVFHAKEKIDHKHIKKIQEFPIIWLPLILLAIPSIVAGSFMLEPLLEDYFSGAIKIHPNHPSFYELQKGFKGWYEMAAHGFLTAPFWLAFSGIVTAWICYVKYPNIPKLISKRFSVLNKILINKFGFDEFYEKIIANNVKTIGNFCWHLGDQWLIDGIGVNGLARTVGRVSILLRKLQSGYIYQYAFFMIFGFLFLIVWLMLSN